MLIIHLGSRTFVSFTVSDRTLKVSGDGTYDPAQSINRLTIYGLETAIEFEDTEQGKAGFRDNTKVFEVEGVKLSLMGESKLSWE